VVLSYAHEQLYLHLCVQLKISAQAELSGYVHFMTNIPLAVIPLMRTFWIHCVLETSLHL